MTIKISYCSFIVLLLWLFSSFSSYAQKEGNIWYFGANAGIDFNGSTPVALTNGAMNSKEGCASICDSDGNILFYTNGVNIWNRNHSIMPNGGNLNGHQSSTQSAIIVKKPGTSTIYFVFTVDREAKSNGLRYSEVDMNLQSGLGDVTSNKNILIITPTCEKIAAIKHQNNSDFWIVTQFQGSNIFYSYLLTSSGLNMTPVVSKIGSVVPEGSPGIGYFKASLNGSRIVTARSQMYQLELFNFNNSTGFLSNSMTFGDISPYGVEFSPKGNLLYVSSLDINGKKIYQYNLLSGSAAKIANSRIIIGSLSNTCGALQLASDGKIYHAQENDS
ncbi:MAG: hypothetical protein HN691_12955, partial [Bacteroidetes bacterium]|nr:hypothetical protein [Bacteroidota bacterium]